MYPLSEKTAFDGSVGENARALSSTTRAFLSDSPVGEETADVGDSG
jgi:hypothetical protein